MKSDFEGDVAAHTDEGGVWGVMTALIMVMPPVVIIMIPW